MTTTIYDIDPFAAGAKAIAEGEDVGAAVAAVQENLREILSATAREDRNRKEEAACCGLCGDPLSPLSRYGYNEEGVFGWIPCKDPWVFYLGRPIGRICGDCAVAPDYLERCLVVVERTAFLVSQDPRMANEFNQAHQIRFEFGFSSLAELILDDVWFLLHGSRVYSSDQREKLVQALRFQMPESEA